MRVLVACETSGVVRDAFIKQGHKAVSCDLEPSVSPGPHIQDDALMVAESWDWDLMVAHPPCTYLSRAGARWLYEEGDRWEKMEDAAMFVRALLSVSIPRIALENPGMFEAARRIVGREPDQEIQPWQFGHPETKKTFLWLKGLPPLQSTNVVQPVRQETINMPDSKRRSELRSRTYSGVARAMAIQWGLGND